MKSRSATKLFNILVILYVIVFGGAIGVFAKFALPAFSPVFLIFIRIVLSLVFFTLLLWYRRKLGQTFKIIWGNLPSFLLLAISGVGLGMITTFWGLNWTSAINYSLLFNATPLAMIFLSAWLLKEKIRPIDLILFVPALAGSILVVTGGEISSLFTREMFWGNLLVFVGAVGWGFYSVYGPALSKKQAKIDSLTLLYGSFLIASVVMVPFLLKMGCADIATLVKVAEINFTTVGATLALSILSTALLFLVWFNLVKAKGGILASFIVLAEDLAGVLLPILLLSEVLTVVTVIGGIMIVLPLLLRESFFAQKPAN